MLAVSISRLMPGTDMTNLLNLPLAKLIRLAALAEVSTETQFLKGEGTEGQKAKNVSMKENMTPDETADALAVAIKRQRNK